MKNKKSAGPSYSSFEGEITNYDAYSFLKVGKTYLLELSKQKDIRVVMIIERKKR